MPSATAMQYQTPRVDRSSWSFPPPATCAASGSSHGLAVTLEDARVFSHNGVVIDSDNRVVFDLSPDFRPPASGHRILDYPGLPEPRTLDAHALVIATPASWKNYFHWMIDALPRLCGIDLSAYDFVFAPLSRPYHHESLRALDIPDDRWLEASADTHLRCTKLTAISTLPIGRTAPAGIDFLRRSFGVRPGTPAHRLSVSRRDAWRRRILNEDVLDGLLAERGFRTVTATGLGIREQALLFSGAAAVIAPHGAALTNLAFAPEGCRVMELFPDNHHCGHYERLAGLCGLPYSARTGPATNRDGDFTVDPDALRTALDQWLA
jgi:capsular polysaccharide biosynthesis protein